MWVRADLKQRAKQSLRGYYWAAVAVCLIFLVLQYAAGTNGGSSATSGNSGTSGTEQVTANIGDNDISYDVQNYTLPQLKNYAEKFVYSETGVGMFTSVVTSAVLFYGILLMIVRICLNYFILNPIQVGMASFFYRNRTEKTSIGELAFAFNRRDFLPVVKTMFLRGLYIFLWTWVFIIPVFIKSYEYRMVDYILAEHPDMPTKEVLNLSRQMMMGHKWNTFVLDMSFFGWAFLGALTFGIVDIFWTNPYMRATEAELYEVLKQPFTGAASQADVF